MSAEMQKGDFFNPTKIKPFAPGMAKDDIYICLRPLLIFGRIFGLVPLSGLFQKDLNLVHFKKFSTPTIIAVFLIVILTGNNTIALIGFFRDRGKDPSELASNIAPFVCYSIGLFVFIYIFRHIEELIFLMHKWRELQLTFRREDETLFRDINLVAGLIYSSAILENAVSHLKLFPPSNSKSDALRFYYENSHLQWAELIPYNPTIAVLVFICNKVTVYAWNFGDILIAVIARTIYFKFKSLMEEASFRLLTERKMKDPEHWNAVVQDHMKLCDILEDFDDFISPLIFASFAVNIYFVCLQLHLGLTPSSNGDFVSALYSAWSFLHLLVRAYVVSLSGARINDHAVSLRKLLVKCPNVYYNIDVERTERRVTVGRIGIGGLNCFVITKPFILSVISIILTFEIVLLQSSAAMSPLLYGSNCTATANGKKH